MQYQPPTPLNKAQLEILKLFAQKPMDLADSV